VLDSSLAVPDSLSADEARRLFLRAQGVLGSPGPADRRAGVPGVLRRLGAVQLDTISVLARSHELVAYARLGAVGRPAVERAYWGEPHQAFEYWAHAASILPMEDWPWFESRRRQYRKRVWSWQAGEQVFKTVRARLAEGPVTASDLGGAKKGGIWWDWSETKIALERLLGWGEAVCVERRGWKRVYDLPERAIPPALLDQQPSDHGCHVHLVRLAGRHLGVATRDDLADYYRLGKASVDASLEASGLVPVAVRGWHALGWADPDGLAALSERGRHRTTLLSPFDSLVWDRARTERVFKLWHRLEAYTPKDKRIHGYFAMPVLAGGRIIGRVDPKRSGRTLVAQRVTLAVPASERVAADIAIALQEAAAWVGCDSVVVEQSPIPIPVPG
jgi:uncharacterized protein YcaQ